MGRASAQEHVTDRTVTGSVSLWNISFTKCISVYLYKIHFIPDCSIFNAYILNVIFNNQNNALTYS